jgi:beta-N-acetylhexosaminidase
MTRSARVAAAVALAAAALVATTNVASARAPLTPATTCTDATVMATWALPSVIHELIVIPVNAPALAMAGAAGTGGYGGIILFGNTGPENFAALIMRLRASVPEKAGLWVMSDEEGGGVWRLANLLTPLPWARALSAKTPAQITSLVKRSAVAMTDLGINMDLAPVLDIDGKDVWPSATDADGYRSFSASGAVVTKDGLAYLRGLTEGGVTGVIKHFPGLGGVSPNTDDGPAKTAPWVDVKKAALKPFVAAITAGAAALMISNASIPGLTTLPASLSPAVYAVIRDQLDFSGLLLTDSLSAGAISRTGLTVPAAATAAIVAGADLVLYGVPAKDSAFTVAKEITQDVAAAVQHGTVARAALVARAAAVVAARGVNLCPAL